MSTALLQMAPATAWFACLTSLLFGALFATLRSAFTLSGRVGTQRLAERYPKVSAKLETWRPRWGVLRATLLIFSMIMEVSAIAFGLIALAPAGQTVSMTELAGVFLILLIFTFTLEVLPLALSESYADRLTILFFSPVTALAYVTWPLAWPLSRIDRYLRRRLMSQSDEEDRPTPEDAIMHLVEKPETMDLEEEEAEIIRSVFEFGETITREIMTPRVDMIGLEDTLTISECIAQIKTSPQSRFPVFHESMDDIQGVVHVKDLLRQVSDGQETQRAMHVAKTVPFVPESMPINDLLQLLRTEQAQIAVVVDEYGGTAGLVTVEDVIEELVGEIQDEYDADEKHVSRLSDGSAILSARVPVEDANELLDIHVPESEEYDSLGGYVFHALGRIPRPGETMDGSDFLITVQTASARRLETLRIQKTVQDG